MVQFFVRGFGQYYQKLVIATKLDIENNLLEAAMRAGGHKTKKAAVTQALIEYVQKRNQASVVDLFGTIDFDDDYDYKSERSRDSNRRSS